MICVAWAAGQNMGPREPTTRRPPFPCLLEFNALVAQRFSAVVFNPVLRLYTLSGWAVFTVVVNFSMFRRIFRGVGVIRHVLAPPFAIGRFENMGIAPW